MFRNSWSKLASRIACLAVLMSAALWLSAPARAKTDCIISQNTKTGAVELLTAVLPEETLFGNVMAGVGVVRTQALTAWLTWLVTELPETAARRPTSTKTSCGVVYWPEVTNRIRLDVERAKHQHSKDRHLCARV